MIQSHKTFFTAAAPIAALCALALGEHFPGKSQDKFPGGLFDSLERAPQLEIVSVDPSATEKSKWEVLGATLVKDAGKRKEIVAALRKSVAEGKDLAKCFDPRHIVRAETNGQVIEMVICFECSRLHMTWGKNNDRLQISISTAAEPVLNKILTDAGIKLAK